MALDNHNLIRTRHFYKASASAGSKALGLLWPRWYLRVSSLLFSKHQISRVPFPTFPANIASSRCKIRLLSFRHVENQMCHLPRPGQQQERTRRLQER